MATNLEFYKSLNDIGILLMFVNMTLLLNDG